MYMLIGALVICAATQGQDLLPSPAVDSTYVRQVEYDWSIRLFGTHKYENQVITNPGARMKYRPLDPVAAGIGFSYKTWVLDLGFRINSNEENTTRRLDFRTSALLGPHLVDLGLLYYKGFEETTDNYENPFRDDIRTLTASLEYLYLPRVRQMSYVGSQTGLQFQERSVGTPVVGGFAERHSIRGDSLLTPDTLAGFSDENQFERFDNRSVGMLFGYARFQRLTDHLFGALIVSSGIGAYWGRKWYTSENDDYISGALIQINAYAALGYSWKRVYAIANYSISSRYIGFGERNVYRYELGRLKFAVGYKLIRL